MLVENDGFLNLLLQVMADVYTAAYSCKSLHLWGCTHTLPVPVPRVMCWGDLCQCHRGFKLLLCSLLLTPRSLTIVAHNLCVPHISFQGTSSFQNYFCSPWLLFKLDDGHHHLQQHHCLGKSPRAVLPVPG